MVFDLTPILRAEKEVVRITNNVERLENDARKARAYKDKLVVEMFQELETRIRRYKREIYTLKEENKALKSELNKDK